MADHPEIKEWAEKLQVLLQEAAKAASSGNPADIVRVQNALREFTLASPSNADALDGQATLAIFDLDLAVSQQAVARIRERAAEVQRLQNLIAGITKEANANASILNGEAAKAAIAAATEAVGSFRKLRDELSTGGPEEKAIADEIDGLLATIQNLRNRLETA